MNHDSSIYVAILSHPFNKGDTTVVRVPFKGQNIEQLKSQLHLPANDLCVVDNKENGQIRAGSKVVFAPAAAWAVLWEIIKGIAWSALITVGVYYLTRGLFDQTLPEKKELPETQSFGWDSFTQRREGIPMPEPYGRNMHYGNIVAKWTDVDDSGSEILYLILDYGRGPVQGRGSNIVYIDDQPAGNFSNLTVQDRLGTTNQTCMTGFEKHKNEYRTKGYEFTYDDGPVTWTTPNQNFNDIEYTLEFLRGIWHYTDMGDQVAHSIGVKVEISERGLATWTTLLNTSISESQMSPVYKKYSVNEQSPGYVERGKKYDLRFTKTTADQGIVRFGDDVGVRSVREVIDVAFRRPGRALLGIIALATERLHGSFNVKWVADGKLVNIYNGTSWSIGYTRNRAWIYFDQVTQPVISGDGAGEPYTIERYEGLSPTRVDTAFIYEWAEWCSQQVDDGNGGTEDRMTCDIICDFSTDVWRLSYEIAQVGRMYPYWQGHTLTGWIDKATDDPIDLITFDCMMARTWKNSYAGYGEMAGCAEVYFKDSLAGYERTSFPVPNENAGTYTRPIDIEGIGVTSQSLAIRIGNHVMQRNALIKNINTCRMFKDALRYKPGRVVRVQATVPNWGKSFRVVNVTSNNTVELDRTLNVSAGSLVYIKSFDDINNEVTVEAYTVQSTVDKTLTIAETWTVTPTKNNVCAIGKTGEIKLRRIIKMSLREDNYIDVELETYDTDLFDSDNLPLYIDDPNYVWPAPSTQLLTPLTEEQVRGIVHQMLPNRPDIEIPWLSNCDWVGDSVDTVDWQKRDAAEPIYFRYRGVAYEITPSSTTDEFIYWDPNYTTQFRTTNDANTALAAGNWLMCVNKSGVAYPANGVQLLHAAILLAGTIRAEQYLELRNTYVYNFYDSLDNSKPFECPFHIVSETIAIVSVKLSFFIKPYRAYSTTSQTDGASTSGAGGDQTTTADGADAVTSAAGGVSWPQATEAATGNTAQTDLGTHYHTMPSHNHEITSDYTEYEDGASSNTGNEDGADNYTGYEDGADNYTGYDSGGGSHRHSISYTNHRHTIAQISHSHSISNTNHRHQLSYINVSTEDPGNTYTAALGYHDHGLNNHTHLCDFPDHTHTVNINNHTHTAPSHTHTTPSHSHGLTYGIHEETNSPQIHYHIDNGSGYGSQSSSYTADQSEIDITSSITGTGAKAIRFDSELSGANGRLRLSVLVECKLDINA